MIRRNPADCSNRILMATQVPSDYLISSASKENAMTSDVRYQCNIGRTAVSDRLVMDLNMAFHSIQ